MLPRRREDKLLIRTLSDETLVYDLKRDQAHCLNRTAATVWQCCDGRTTIAELAEKLRSQCNLAADETAVWLALRQLQKACLLCEPVRPPAEQIRTSRRDLIRKLGAAAAVPIVMTILAPTARAQASDTCSNTLPTCIGKTCPGTLTCMNNADMCSCV
jgi:hypothetical protein